MDSTTEGERERERERKKRRERKREHVLKERRGDKFNFVELAGGTCKLARNELCYIVLDVQLEFRRENRVAPVERDGIIEDRDMQIR